MSTLTFGVDSVTGAMSTLVKALGLLARFDQAQEARAKSRITALFTRMSDARLVDLGFDASDIAAIRRGEHRLPKSGRTA